MSQQQDNIILSFYVKRYERDDDGTLRFRVLSTRSGLAWDVARTPEDVWACLCGGVYIGTMSRSAPTCDHIYRAWLYHKNMIAHTKDLKDKLKTMTEETRKLKQIMDGAEPKEESPFLKRKIRLED